MDYKHLEFQCLAPSFWMYYRFWLLCNIQNGNRTQLLLMEWYNDWGCGDTSHTYWQGYENSYPFFLFPPKYKLDNYIIHKGDTISFFIDNDKNGNYIKSDRFIPGEGHSFESDEVIYTEGLIVNGKEIESPLVAAFIRTPLAWLGGGSICFYIWWCLFVIDFGMWYNKKNIDKKIKKYFYNQNMFIR